MSKNYLDLKLFMLKLSSILTLLRPLIHVGLTVDADDEDVIQSKQKLQNRWVSGPWASFLTLDTAVYNTELFVLTE